MSFLLDTNICSARIRGAAHLTHRFVQHGGRLFVPTVALGELYTWAYRRDDPASVLHGVAELLTEVQVLHYDQPCAEVYGRVRGQLLRQGLPVGPVDLMIASVALAHDLTLVTHNTADFGNIPGVRLEDWLAS